MMKNVRILNALCRPKKKSVRERERVKKISNKDTSEIVRRLKAVNHWISPVSIRFYWINSIKWAADFAVHIFVYLSLVDERFYSPGVLCCVIWNTEIFNTENQGTFVLQNLYQSRMCNKPKKFNFQHLSPSARTSVFKIPFQNISFFLYLT